MAEEVTLPELSVDVPDASNGQTPTGDQNQETTRDTNSTTNQTVTPDSKNTVSNGDLPWAIVAMPTTSSGMGGVGSNKHALQPEDWVYGIWLDGDNCQQPLILGVIPGSSGSAGSGSGVGGYDGGSGGSGGSSGDGSGPVTGGDVGTSKVQVTQNAQTVYNVLRKNGYTHEQAAGIMGNIRAESNFNPGAEAKGDQKDGSSSRGIAQWDPSRWNRFLRMFPGKRNSVEAQTQYLVWELNNTEGIAGRLIKSKQNDVVTATIGMANSERFQGYSGKRARATGNGYPANHPELRKRIGYAKGYAASMKPSSGSTEQPKPKVRVTLPNAQ